MQSPPSIKNEAYKELLDKLVALRIPPLKGKRFLDINCIDGFYCGYAAFNGAAEVVGIDNSGNSIELARVNFPQCDFRLESWETLPDHSFDIILHAFASYHTNDLGLLIHKLMGKLAIDGTLIMEIGVVETRENQLIVKDGELEFTLPSWTTVRNILDIYAWKSIGHRDFLKEKKISQYVIHISNMKPYAFLLLEPPASGKSTIQRVAFKKPGLQVVSGDQILLDIFNDRISTSPQLEKLVKTQFISTSIAKLTKIIFTNGLGLDLIHTWCEQAGYNHFVLDSYLHKKFHQQLHNHIKAMGYVPVTINWSMDSCIPLPKHAIAATEKYRTYLQTALKIHALEKLPTFEYRSRNTPSKDNQNRFFSKIKKAIASINK